jgi:starvation-inducible DNA-binding protein
MSIVCEKICPNYGMDANVMKGVTESLYQIYADLFLMGEKSVNYSFNVTGPRFMALRELFKENAKEICESTCKIGENIRYLGAR